MGCVGPVCFGFGRGLALLEVEYIGLSYYG
jgi:hypothetical protein